MADNSGGPENAVVKEIVRRCLEGITDDSHRVNGGAKLGLVVEGGGMRGVYSGGVLVAMEQMGLTSVFDEVYGESAGAINSCYFLAGQAKYGSAIYLDDLTSLRFVNPFRIGKIIDLDYAIDVVVKFVKPLDVGRVLASRSGLHIAITSALTGEARLVDAKREGIPLLTLLKASGAIAPLYNCPVLIDGIPYVDGGITNPIPVRSAIEDGCTHILVLLTRPPDFVSPGYTAVERFCMAPLFRSWTPAFVNVFYEQQHQRYNATRAVAFGKDRGRGGVNIAVIGPDAKSPAVSRATVLRGRLQAAMDDAMRKTRDVFADLRSDGADSGDGGQAWGTSPDARQ
jgi:predicted patatin/cPLA2 family phospholipase